MAEVKQNICTLCSLGCGLLIEVDDGNPVGLDYRTDYPVNEGALCAKGNYALELLNHRLRLSEPLKNGAVIGWGTAASETAHALASPAAALIAEGDMSEEEAGLLASFASACLAPERVAVSFSTGDGAVIGALEELPVRRATIEDLKDSACTIAVNDPFSVGPVVARWVMQARSAARENTLNVIAPAENVVSRFAGAKLIGPVRRSLLCLLKKLIGLNREAAPAWARAAMTGLDSLEPAAIESDAARLAEEFSKASSGVILLSSADPVAARLAACCSLVAGHTKKLFVLNDYGNAAGICRRIRTDASVESILNDIARGSIDTLVVLGTDVVSSYPASDAERALKKLKLLVAGAAFPTKTTELAHVVLPTAIWLEKDGTFNGAFQHAVAPPVGGARSYGDILEMVARAMRTRLEQPPGVSREPSELDDDSVARLVSEAAKRADEAPRAVVSSTTRFADGSLTDNLSWPLALACEAAAEGRGE